jgi:hypothetical protein
MGKDKGAPVTTVARPSPALPDARALASAKRAVLPGSAEAGEMGLAQQSPAVQSAVRLAQVVNLHIAGYSLGAIGAALGCSADEVDRMLSQDTARYVRNQPALRAYVRNWISQRYTAMIEADYREATDASHPKKLEHQDRVMRMLGQMAKLHGAEAPSQLEVQMDAAPEAVDKMVQALSQAMGGGYDTEVFDAEVVEDAVHEIEANTEAAGQEAERAQPYDEEWTRDTA